MKHWNPALRLLGIILVFALSAGTAAMGAQGAQGIEYGDHGRMAYEYLRWIDREYPDRDSAGGQDIGRAREWIVSELKACGYPDRNIRMQEFTFRPDGGKSRKSANVIATLQGRTDAQIIIGAHYDGEGAGDNGSGTALLLETACRLSRGDPPLKTLVFVFFSAEEYEYDGSAAFVKAMSREEIARTEFMVNLDSLITGDYCYIYGGVADFDRETVEKTEALERTLAISQRLGLPIRLIPWTFDRPAPGFRTPDYPSPSTGDWSDHIHFAKRGIPYVYFEASNWEIPGPDRQYDGDSETEKYGRIMHTDRDRLAVIESLFPGRALAHLQVFSLLLHEVLTSF